MTQGSSSVVVVPQDWEGGIDELARKMMPVTRQPSAQVLPLLERGPMTIEADLSLAEAERLQERLRALGVPARIVAFGEEVGPFQALGSGSKEQKLRAALGRSAQSEAAPADLKNAIIHDAIDEVGWGQIFAQAAELEDIEDIEDTKSAPEVIDDELDAKEIDSAFGAE